MTVVLSVRDLSVDYGQLRAVSGVTFEIRFDFVEHRLVIGTNLGGVESFALVDGLSVAEFDASLHASSVRASTK